MRWVPDSDRVGAPKGNHTSRVDGGLEDAPHIVPDDAPNVLKEAAQLAAHPGVRCIWVDSLSIVQDETDGWKREASKMASYYQKIWLTFAETSSESQCVPFDPEVLPRVVQLL